MNRPIWKQYLKELFVYLIYLFTLVYLDWKKALLFICLPHYFAKVILK